jgi:hypothetical protein
MDKMSVMIRRKDKESPKYVTSTRLLGHRKEVSCARKSRGHEALRRKDKESQKYVMSTRCAQPRRRRKLRKRIMD